MAEEKKASQTSSAPVRPGRNDPCHCGSGKKYKKCHLEQDEAEERKRLQAAAAQAASAEPTKAPGKPVPFTKPPKNNPPVLPHAKGGFNRTMFKRKTGES